MKRIRSLIVRAVPPIERWPSWLVRVVEARALTGSVICSAMALEMIIALVPATYHVGITHEAIQIWGFALLLAGAALWFANEAAWIDSTRGSQP